MGALLVLHEDWNVGIVAAPIDAFLSPGRRYCITWLPRRRGRFAADPFAIRVAGVTHVFFEDFDQRTGKGVISHVGIADDSMVTPPQVALNLPVHTSYPYLIEDGDAVYCIPETAGAREVALYRADEFPLRWRKIATLLEDVAVCDPTVFRHGGRWWLFGTRIETGQNHRLFAWYADDLFGPWQSHVANPIKCDIRSARPAGTPFMHEGSLYRPAQNCSATYGGQVVINRIIELSPTVFSEETVRVVRPHRGGYYPRGLHTLSAAGDVTLIDAKCHIFVLHQLWRVLRRWWQRSKRMVRRQPAQMHDLLIHEPMPIEAQRCEQMV